MTHYEELGVSPDAPAEEIRRAFRRTSRLLHPDLQSVPELRQAAEVQMRRLNEIVEMLCEPESRAEYDRSLGQSRPSILVVSRPEPASHPGLPPALPAEPARSPIPPSLIAGLAFGALAMFCWNIVSSAPVVVDPAPAESSSVAPGSGTVGPQRLAPKPSYRAQIPSQGATAPATAPALTPDAAVAAPAPTPEAPVENAQIPNTSIPHASIPQTSIPHASIPHMEASRSVAPSPLPPAAPARKSLDGVWLLYREPNAQLEPGEFAAEFVELRLQQNGERFTALYRSRYRTPDRMSTPEVNFRFEGSVHAQEFPWSGRNGSQGKVRLTVQSAEAMQLEWVAESRIPGSLFTQGSAKLVRLKTD